MAENGGTIQRTALMFAGPLALLLIWYLVFLGGLVTPKLLPSPFRTIEAVWENTLTGGLSADFWQTLVRTLRAFAIAALFGIPLGIVIDRVFDRFLSLDSRNCDVSAIYDNIRIGRLF